MSILIKGMEMPESCYYCPFADGVWQKNKRCLINGKEMPRDGRDVQQNHINCPLIEIPLHGDLVDVDELLKKKWSVLWNGESFYVVNADDLIEAPTIVEEENGV